MMLWAEAVYLDWKNKAVTSKTSSSTLATVGHTCSISRTMVVDTHQGGMPSLIVFQMLGKTKVNQTKNYSRNCVVLSSRSEP
jgi:hypothetical protein